MAKKVLKTRIQFTSTLKNELYEALKAESNTSMVPISKLLDAAVEALLEVRQERRKSE